MVETLKERWYQSRLGSRTSKEKLAREKSITDALLGQDFVSDDAYREILESHDFALLQEDRQGQLRHILDILNSHFKEEKIFERAFMDESDKTVELYESLLPSMKNTLSRVDKTVVDYQEFIASEIKTANKAILDKDFQKAAMIANLARNLARPFAPKMKVMFEKLKKPFSNTGAKIQKDPRFQKIYDEINDQTKLIKSYAPSFWHLYREAQDVLNTANRNRAEIYNRNRNARSNITVDGNTDIIQVNDEKSVSSVSSQQNKTQEQIADIFSVSSDFKQGEATTEKKEDKEEDSEKTVNEIVNSSSKTTVQGGESPIQTLNQEDENYEFKEKQNVEESDSDSQHKQEQQQKVIAEESNETSEQIQSEQQEQGEISENKEKEEKKEEKKEKGKGWFNRRLDGLKENRAKKAAEKKVKTDEKLRSKGKEQNDVKKTEKGWFNRRLNGLKEKRAKKVAEKKIEKEKREAEKKADNEKKRLEKKIEKGKKEAEKKSEKEKKKETRAKKKAEKKAERAKEKAEKKAKRKEKRAKFNEKVTLNPLSRVRFGGKETLKTAFSLPANIIAKAAHIVGRPQSLFVGEMWSDLAKNTGRGFANFFRTIAGTVYKPYRTKLPYENIFKDYGASFNPEGSKGLGALGLGLLWGFWSIPRIPAQLVEGLAHTVSETATGKFDYTHTTDAFKKAFSFIHDKPASSSETTKK